MLALLLVVVIVTLVFTIGMAYLPLTLTSSTSSLKPESKPESVVAPDVQELKPKALKKKAACGKACGALDPVSSVEYNIENILKQSVLLEEHLAVPNKRCSECIVKHFHHIIGLSEEAQTLAGNDQKKYPFVESNVDYYEALLERYLNDPKSSDNLLQLQEKLRSRRKVLVHHYILNTMPEKDEDTSPTHYHL